MYPLNLMVHYDNSVYKYTSERKQVKVSMEDISEKELLLRQVILNQSIRAMLLFLVWIAIIEIIAGIVIIGGV